MSSSTSMHLVYTMFCLEAINSITERKKMWVRMPLVKPMRVFELLDKADSIVEVSIIKHTDWHIADDRLA